MVCGPQVVCQMSKGLQNELQTISWDRHIHPHTRHKGAKTTGSGSRRQTEDNVLQLGPPWGGPKVFIALSKKERKNWPDWPHRHKRPISAHVQGHYEGNDTVPKSVLVIVSSTSPRWKAATFHPKGGISKQLVTNSAELASHKLPKQAKSPDKMNHS